MRRTCSRTSRPSSSLDQWLSERDSSAGMLEFLCFILVNKAFVLDFNTENTQVFITAVKSFYALCQAPLKVEVLEPSWTQSSMTGAE